MDLRHLRYFLAVAEKGHFGRAAQQLHIVQSALSERIRALEDELGAPLFERNTRKVTLTDAGRLLVVEARRTLDQAEHAKTVVQRAAAGDTGVVRIGFIGNAIASARLSGDLAAFHACWPDVVLDLYEMAPAAQQDAILAGRLDIGYCPMLGTAFDAKLTVRVVASWPWGVLMSERHPLAKRRSVSVAALEKEHFIIIAPDGYHDKGHLEMVRHILGKEPRVAYTVTSSLSGLALMAAGLGLTLSPEPMSRFMMQDVVYRKLAEPSPKSQLAVISRVGAEWGANQRYLEMLDQRPA